jgi:hypothetical protein
VVDFRFDSRNRPKMYQRGLEDGRDGMPITAGPYTAEYREGWYHGYRDQLKRDVQAYNARHGTNFEPRGPY